MFVNTIFKLRQYIKYVTEGNLDQLKTFKSPMPLLLLLIIAYPHILELTTLSGHEELFFYADSSKIRFCAFKTSK